LTFRGRFIYSYFFLMSCFLVVYALGLFLFWSYHSFTAHYMKLSEIFSGWLIMMIIYPLAFSALHFLLIKRHKRILRYAL
ncbi:MAG: hypothetical protein AAF621_07805, partial [Pseudomonadota bacterium]